MHDFMYFIYPGQLQPRLSKHALVECAIGSSGKAFCGKTTEISASPSKSKWWIHIAATQGGVSGAPIGKLRFLYKTCYREPLCG